MVKREEDWWCLWRKMYKFSWIDGFTNINFLVVLWILVRCHFPRFVCLYCAHYCLLANGRNQPHILFFSEFSLPILMNLRWPSGSSPPFYYLCRSPKKLKTCSWKSNLPVLVSIALRDYYFFFFKTVLLTSGVFQYYPSLIVVPEGGQRVIYEPLLQLCCLYCTRTVCELDSWVTWLFPWT